MQRCGQERETINKNDYFPEDNSTKFNVIIIGAGASGIAAATRLCDNDIKNFIILEAENRIGGRIYTTEFEGFTVDVGAQFCHGKDGNAVYEMVKDLDLLDSELGKLLYTPYHSSGKKLNVNLFNEFFDLFEKFFYEDKDKYECSFGEYMLKRTNETILGKYGKNSDMHEMAMEALNTYKLDLLANEGPFSWFDVSADEDYEECEGDKLLGWKGRGFKTILDILTKKYPDPTQELNIFEKILLNKKITNILWDGEQVTVNCKNNLYTADHVIFTPSLGVLKKYYNSMFVPMLPKEKVEAITTIGMGSVIKIVYYFPVIWWPEDARDFTFVWSNEDREQVVSEFPETVLKSNKSWLTDVLQLIRIANSPNLLGAWICGESVPEVELLPDESIINGTMFLINKFLGHLFPNICKPDKILREGWYANTNFMGVYSYQTTTSRAVPGDSQEVVLSRPLMSSDGVPRLLFAGEATSPTHYGTVHGAIETGWREADRIIVLYK